MKVKKYRFNTWNEVAAEAIAKGIDHYRKSVESYRRTWAKVHPEDVDFTRFMNKDADDMLCVFSSKSEFGFIDIATGLDTMVRDTIWDIVNSDGRIRFYISKNGWVCERKAARA